MTGTSVSANQGGCTCWCDDCGETHNCESWGQERILDWMSRHLKECPAGRQRRIRDAVRQLEQEDGVPADALDAIRRYADGIGRR